MSEQPLPDIDRHVARAVFPSLLRATRERSGVTGTALAHSLRVAQHTYAQYEGGSRLPDHAKLRVLLETMGLDERLDVLAHVLHMARRGTAHRDQAVRPRSGTDARERFEVLARLARRATLYEPGVVPSMARTPGYEAALREHRGDDPWWEPRPEPRDDTPVELFVDEQAVRVGVGGARVMAGQVEALLNPPGAVTVVRLVMPTPLVNHPTRGLPVSLLDVAPSWWCGYTHTPLGGQCHEGPQEVARCAERLVGLRAASVGGKLTKELLEGLLSDYRSQGYSTRRDQASG